jgi:hypothetical protein
MLLKTESDGDFTSITISDSGKKFEFELYIKNNTDGSLSIDYYNSSRECYNLLNILSSGEVKNEVPVLE